MTRRWTLKFGANARLSMYHYKAHKEMQFDLNNNVGNVCTNITVEAAKKIRDRLDEFIKFHSSRGD